MTERLDFVCLSHLRWNFVYQRPNHLMSRAARSHRVFFVEEPIFDDGAPRMEVMEVEPQLLRAVPHVPESARADHAKVERILLDDLLRDHDVERFVAWYYTPMALASSRHLQPEVTVFDCMDELSNFAGAPPALREREEELLRRAGVVFTGGQSLYEAKRHRHHNIHAFPSSVDVAHFAQARTWIGVPADQAEIPRPRIGYFGVIDERIDLGLLAALADAQPEWQIVMVGPLAKIDEASLPRRPNIHYLGPKPYSELPAYLATWDAALMPFAINDATRFISPTKTPEFLAAGRPVISTPIRDVVRPYGELGIVKIAATVPEMVEAIAGSLGDGASAREKADRLLADMSWDETWRRMYALVMEARGRRETRAAPRRREEEEPCSIT